LETCSKTIPVSGVGLFVFFLHRFSKHSWPRPHLIRYVMTFFETIFLTTIRRTSVPCPQQLEKISPPPQAFYYEECSDSFGYTLGKEPVSPVSFRALEASVKMGQPRFESSFRLAFPSRESLLKITPQTSDDYRSPL